MTLTQQQLHFVQDQARRALEQIGGRFVGSPRDITEGERLGLAYIEGVMRLLIKNELATTETLKLVLIEADSAPEAEDYE